MKWKHVLALCVSILLAASVTHATAPIISTVYETVKGANLSSTGSNVTIALTSSIHHITGTGSVQTMSLPVTGFVGCVYLVPDAAFTTVTGGNIAKASTAVVDKTLIMCFDGTDWTPSY
jgi:hypothetical protein